VRQKIEIFFVLLMRLNDSTAAHGLFRELLQAHIQGYSVQGNSLVVTYYQVPVLQEVGTLHTTAVAAGGLAQVAVH
jgi:hypothetical protein